MLLAAWAPLALGAVYPERNLSDSQGWYEGLYMVVRDVNAAPLSAATIAQIETSSEITRRFYAASSGGAFDLRYTQIVDVPLTLNADKTRIGDWIADAENYVRSQYGLEPEDFHSNIFDVSRTEPDPDQGWSGLAWIPSNNFAIQADINTDWGRIVLDHELGHRIGAPHAGALRLINDNDYTPYVYDYAAEAYVEHSFDDGWPNYAPLGAHHDEYGDPFDVMGNISHGHFTVHEKTEILNWLRPSLVPDVDRLGEGVVRVYAHDELDVVYDAERDMYGVEEGYRRGAYYGLQYTREVEEFDLASGEFRPRSQQVTLEYRSGGEGLQVRLDDVLVDLDPRGGSNRDDRRRELGVGRSVREIDFGVTYFAARSGDEDFPAETAPAPTRPWELLPSWYEFSVLEQGADEIGSYVDVRVAIEDYAIETGVDGDLNLDGVVNRDDWIEFASYTHTDLSHLTATQRYLAGDFNSDGANNHGDFVLFQEKFDAANGLNAFALMLRVPEPASALLAGGLGLIAWRPRPTRTRL